MFYTQINQIVWEAFYPFRLKLQILPPQGHNKIDQDKADFACGFDFPVSRLILVFDCSRATRVQPLSSSQALVNTVTDTG